MKNKIILLFVVTLLLNAASAFDYGGRNLTLETNKTIPLTSDFSKIKNQFDGAGNYTVKKDFAAFSTDLGDCGKAVIKKYNLSMETGIAFHTISAPAFLAIMDNGTEAAVKKAIIGAVDPFFEKLTGFDHDQVVKSMPQEVINWVKSTAYMIKSVKDNLAKEYAEDRIKAQTVSLNKTDTSIVEDKSVKPNPIIVAPNAADSQIYVKGAANTDGSLNKTQEEKL